MLKFQIESRKIEWGIAVKPLVLITTCLMYRNRFLVISRDGLRIELGSATDTDRLRCVFFRTAVYTNFQLDRERRLLQLS